MTSQQIVNEVLRCGWMTLQTLPESNLLELGCALGEPIPSRSDGPLVDILRVIDANNAKERSLSAKFGKEAFPWHTDMAHIRIPPRFVVMKSIGSSGRQTLLLDGNQLCRNRDKEAILKTDVWLVNGGRGRFLTPILNDTLVPDSCIFRYDRCVMRPMRPSAESVAFIDSLENREPTAAIEWHPGLCLVLDNWRMLHARAPRPAEPELDRLIERVLVRN